MTRMIELIDTFTNEAVTVSVGDVGTALRQWFESDPYAGPGDSLVENFTAALLASDYAARGLADGLGVEFREVYLAD